MSDDIFSNPTCLACPVFCRPTHDLCRQDAYFKLAVAREDKKAAERIEKRKAYDRRLYEQTKERRIRQMLEWQRENRDRRNAYQRTRRARLKAITPTANESA